ncbi:MAG: HPP family protein [Burkholderiales bacterium]|nr:HPP family protein [Burkholderiales bacterium]
MKIMIDAQTVKHALFAGMGGFIAILPLVSAREFGAAALIMVPFGATCVLLFALPEAPLSQAPNVIGGHVLYAPVASGAILLVLLATLYHRATGTFSYPIKLKI